MTLCQVTSLNAVEWLRARQAGCRMLKLPRLCLDQSGLETALLLLFFCCWSNEQTPQMLICSHNQLLLKTTFNKGIMLQVHVTLWSHYRQYDPHTRKVRETYSSQVVSHKSSDEGLILGEKGGYWMKEGKINHPMGKVGEGQFSLSACSSYQPLIF